MTLQAENPTPTAAAQPVVRKVGGRIGARVEGVRLGGDLDAATVATLRAALLEHKALFFGGQGHLDDESHLAFVSLFGSPTTAHPTVRGEKTHVLPVDSDRGKANSWHTDVTFVDRIPAISSLRTLDLPPYGGTTVFANTGAAYASLPLPLKNLVDELWAVHTNAFDYARDAETTTAPDDDRIAAYRAEFRSTTYETEHPVVRVHPETGERVLVLGHFVREFVGLNSKESQTVYHLLQDRIVRLENTVRWNWSDGDFVLFDNRATQHYAVADYDDHHRALRRITLAGDIPVSPSGARSVVRTGDSSHYTN
ncbi:Alpha-ketoglutarate-dependent taurine dioxygenase [Pseudonocardia sp. Ae406_Ps2]|uniref:TauD/TfdA dioxygenase family protein n=1 Tax=unclassified Pseudonocardia TaxID=2619320 RepID=UPI000318D0E1|nr:MULTISPECIES: TauD/TfdA family dioxygenase [unclassified Pseudonocardia]OLM01948.1 Alpha-ketoglutarate-dependent taurine dioxygenase [Pseudonocardia sp. Ae406_Ps2]OLM06265.1 Alpha-ketoglutarate-dependent taurine dioxygenase [Pseudonocardia sp. Ae331_Ps2]OLM13004.1 Alpha-ketoglutarate-dependent taurine dioxygenase [Pseudonocardia sp. Ae505_Ps2]OLM23524.1 Alpha-ketoglutarate-dependent taurine dioxygenase [Pseudonocardia sp. Ae706_Ps2]OLM32568.1 Alpha-ketoglutarate-dependent taurine dioxygenas